MTYDELGKTAAKRAIAELRRAIEDVGSPYDLYGAQSHTEAALRIIKEILHRGEST